MSFTFFKTRNELEQTSKAEQQMSYLGGREFLAKSLGRYFIYLDADDTSLTPRIGMDGFWEAWITLALGRLLKPDSFYVDVGANCGYYSLLMAEALEGKGKLVAVEANPRMALLLEKTLKKNDLNRVSKVVPKAATAEINQTLELIIPSATNLGGASICRHRESGDFVVEVQTTTIDELTKFWPRVDLVKIDAEGSEEMVWEGMKRVVAENDNLIVMLEFNRVRYQNAEGFLKKITTKGFELKYIDFDAEIKAVTVDKLLNSSLNEDWMLFLRKA